MEFSEFLIKIPEIKMLIDWFRKKNKMWIEVKQLIYL